MAELVVGGMSRREALDLVRSRYIGARLNRVEPEFWMYEEDMARTEDLVRLATWDTPAPIPNLHNSALLYITGVSNEYDPLRYVDTVGGTQPDIDLDFDTLDYEEIMKWVVDHYGRENVANIMALQRMKPRSTARKWGMVTEPPEPEARAEHQKLVADILSKIPPPLYGKEPTLEETIHGNIEKRYRPNPELAADERYQPWYNVAQKLEGMVSTFSIHAAGVVISDNPISDVMPVWYRKGKDEFSDGRDVGRWATQFTMEEVADLGLIKFDFLRLETLSILKETLRLIRERHGVTLEPYRIADGDVRAYKLIGSGMVAGLFQLETSESAKRLCMRVKPTCVGELSDVSALNRPGPIQAGLVDAYVRNKSNGHPPEDMPASIAELLKDTYWTLTYQEQIMSIVSKVAGFSLKEADDVRRAIGKKNVKYIMPRRQAFIDGCVASGVDEDYATEFWDGVIVGLADYAFNKSHSICYSYLTYITAWLKANYTVEFFAALMSVRSKTLAPDKWAEKAPDYVVEAKNFGIAIRFPDVNRSDVDFRIDGDSIYFGFGAIKKVGVGSANLIIKARAGASPDVVPFTDIEDFLGRVDRQKLNTGVFKQLVGAGVFDAMGYARADLMQHTELMYSIFQIRQERRDREDENALRILENEQIDRLLARRDDLRSKLKKKVQLEPEELAFLEEHKRLLRKKPLALPEVPEWPVLARHKKLSVSISELLTQGELLGCFVLHPAGLVYPNTTRITNIGDVGKYDVAGVVTELKSYRDSEGGTTYVSITDGTGSLRLPVRTPTSVKIPKKGDLIHARVRAGLANKMDEDNPTLRVTKVWEISIYGE